MPLFRARELPDTFYSVTHVYVEPAGDILDVTKHNFAVGVKPHVVKLDIQFSGHQGGVLRTSIRGLARYVALKAWVSCHTKVALF